MKKEKEMCGTADSSFHFSNALNNTGIWSLIELVSLYPVPLRTVNGFSRLSTTSIGRDGPKADLKIFESAHHFQIESNGRFESWSFAGP